MTDWRTITLVYPVERPWWAFWRFRGVVKFSVKVRGAADLASAQIEVAR